MRYKWKNTVYNILVENPNNKETEVSKIKINEKEQESNEIKLQENGGVININIIM